MTAIIADTLDVVIVTVLHAGTFTDYTSIDKLLDIYALGFAAFRSFKWENKIASNTSILLFLYRLTGVVLVAITGYRWLLFVFPNVFEMFYVYHLSTVKWFQGIQVNRGRRLIAILSLLTLLKLVQEYVLHLGGIHSSSYVYAILLAAICCLPTTVASLIYLLLHVYHVRTGAVSRGVRSARQSRIWGLVTFAIALWFLIFWIGLASLDFTVEYEMMRIT